MLMQPRPHFPQIFNPGELPDSSPASTYFDTPSYQTPSDLPSTHSAPNSYFFTDPFASSNTYLSADNSSMSTGGYHAASQLVGRQNQSHDWQAYNDASQQSARMTQSAQNPRKRFRPNDRSFSNDLKKSPSTYSQHLPTPTQTPTQPSFLDNTYLNPNNSAMSAALGLHVALDQQQYDDLPGYAHSTGHSVSSYGHDSPATPRTMNGEELEHPNMPKFDRTVSDAFVDELYNPQSFTSHPGSKYIPTNSSLLSPYSNRNSISDRLQAANQARSVSPQDPTQRNPSPFRQGSPLAPPVDFVSNSQGHIGTAAGVRQQQKMEADAIAYQQHHPRTNASEPATISPKDAVLEYHESAEDMDTPLYPATSTSESMHHSYAPMNNMQSSQYAASSGNFFMPPGLPTGSSGEIPLYLTNPYRPNDSSNSMSEPMPDFPASLLSMETSASASDFGADNIESSQGSERHVLKPNNASANRGVYTCTASGCAQRFESPGKLQKHKREAHRATPNHQPHPSQQRHQQAVHQQNSASSSPRNSADAEDADAGGRIGSSMTSAALMQRNAQAGPHRCSRVNPSTGKPCNTVFSRPYDLTRHEDTIHVGRQKKVQCHLCTEEKTFSRSDALTRHMRVVHPEVDFPGKHRRRHVG